MMWVKRVSTASVRYIGSTKRRLHLRTFAA
jgi:hypothetical protein